MKAIKYLNAAERAYYGVGWELLRTVYVAGPIWGRILVWLISFGLFAIATLFVLEILPKGECALLLLVTAALYIGACEVTIRGAYGYLRKTLGPEITKWRNRDWLRIEIFQRKLRDQKFPAKNSQTLDKVRRLLEAKSEAENVSIITKHPFSAFFLGAILAAIGGIAGVDESWKNGLSEFILVAAIFLFLTSALVVMVFGAKRLTSIEITRYLSWLQIANSFTTRHGRR